jgi:hypothetical protein
VPRIPPQILIHNTDIQPRWFKEDISFHPLNSKGKKIIAPIICSREIIKNEGRLNKFWRINPSRLHKIAVKITAKGGRYFFIP